MQSFGKERRHTYRPLGRRPPAAPSTGKATEDKTAATGATPTTAKAPEDKTAPTGEQPPSAGEKSPAPEKEAPDTPPADKPLEPGETGKVPLSQVCVPKNKDEFRVNPYGPLFTATAETLMDEKDVYKPLQVKKNKSGLYELMDPRDAMLLAAASSLHLPSITVQVQPAKAKDRVAEQLMEEKMLRVPLSELHAFSQHKWRVQDNTPSTLELTASIREMGVTEPVIVRADPKGGYEVLSGHRRLRASQLSMDAGSPGRENGPLVAYGAALSEYATARRRELNTAQVPQLPPPPQERDFRIDPEAAVELEQSKRALWHEARAHGKTPREYLDGGSAVPLKAPAKSPRHHGRRRPKGPDR